jgi:hypothetical protein
MHGSRWLASNTKATLHHPLLDTDSIVFSSCNRTALTVFVRNLMAQERVRGALSAGTRVFLALMPLAHAFPNPHWHQPAASKLGSRFAIGQCCPLRHCHGGSWTRGGAAFRRAGMRHGSRESACMSLDPLILVVHAAGVPLTCFSDTFVLSHPFRTRHATFLARHRAK